jgi:hypothetical protein
VVGSPYGWLPRRHDGSDGEDFGESCGGGATGGWVVEESTLEQVLRDLLEGRQVLWREKCDDIYTLSFS